MLVERLEWNVVIVGFWNLAIFTPARIGKRLFEAKEGTNLSVLVPIDIFAPHRVQEPDGPTVVPEVGRLVIIPKKSSFHCLEQAMAIGIRALEWLPETPVFATGINMRFRVCDMPCELSNSIKVEVDDSLSVGDFQIKRRTLRRSLDASPGTLNLEIDCDSDEGTEILLNYERKSENKEDLKEWLKKPIPFFQDMYSRVFDTVLHIPLKEEANDL